MGWRARYRRVVRSSFATVPFYRERWALSGRTDPVVVSGRFGDDGGAVPVARIAGRLPELVPLAGGRADVDPVRGLGTVLRPPAGSLVVMVGALPPMDLPEGVRCAVVEPSEESVVDFTAPSVIAVGAPKDLARLANALPEHVRQVPLVAIDELADVDTGLIADDVLGILGDRRDCGQWHLDWQRVYARATPLGLAFTLLRQQSPRLVDVVPVEGARGAVASCPRHGSPVIVP
ncbi:hypothetical protein Acsp05_24930 [Actinokineospora sp. NBRC 105648]|nr:hypothetical protein Acsp05_24930 [Actinokineospora sp. NBRC 105648]